MESLLGPKFMDLICEFMIKSSLVLGVSLFFVFLFRKKSASMKHFFLSFSLISLLLFPFLSTLTTRWETRWLPSWQTAQSNILDFNEKNKNESTLLHLNHKDNASQANSIQQPRFEEVTHQNKKSDFLKTIDIKMLLGVSLITIWAAGLIFLLIRIFLGLYGAYKLTRQGRRVSESFWQLLLQRFLDAVSIKRKICLLSHDNVKVPLTWGVIKPVVIMPTEARNWNKDQCSSALFHELSHIKRSDFLVKILARFSCALYWFNPLSWLVFRLMKKEQEKACDELVLKAGVKPSIYAASLLSIQEAGQIQWDPPAAVLGAVGKSQLNERLLAILKQQLRPKEVKMKTKVLFSFFIIAAIAFIGLARPSQSAVSNEMIFSNNDISLTEIQNPAQAENVQEKQEEKKTKEAEKEETADKKDKKDKKKKIIQISKNGKTKRITVTGMPLVIMKKEDPEKEFVLSISGKDLELEKGEESCWTLKADELHIINGDKTKVIKLDKDNVFNITIEKGKDGKSIHIIKSPEIHIKKALSAPLCYTIQIEGDKEGKKKLLIVSHVDMNFGVPAAPYLALHPLLHLETGHEKLRERLKKLRESLKKIRELQDMDEKAEAREEALRDIEEVLEDLSDELEKKSDELEDIKLRSKTDLKHKLLDKIKHTERIKVNLPFIKIEGDKKIISFVDKDKGLQLIIKSKFNNENKGEYEEFLERLKKSLPEGYKVESEIDEENNTITIKITNGKKDDRPKEETNKLVREIVDEISKIEKKTSKNEINGTVRSI